MCHQAQTGGRPAGVHVAIEATIEHLNGRRGLAGASVLVQGVGNVGSALVRRLREDGAHVYISDVDESHVQALSAETGATAVRRGSETEYEVDVFAPCGLGGVLTEEFSAALRARSVCGAANNQRPDKGVADLLREQGILYAPDFVANSGGVISASSETAVTPWSRGRVKRARKTPAATGLQAQHVVPGKGGVAGQGPGIGVVPVPAALSPIARIIRSA